MRRCYLLWILVGSAPLLNCGRNAADTPNLRTLQPRVITQPVRFDSDDPAIWVNPEDPAQSLILGTDKNTDGALYVYGLDGKIIEEKTVRNLKRPNNVDVEYGLMLQGKPTDIAVATEREANKIRVFRLPDMAAIDNGGIDVFTGQGQREPMGIACYRRSADGAIFAIVGRKSGPTAGGYLWQYRLDDDGAGCVKGIKVREFGLFSGRKEIEAVAVDDPLDYVYYADEQVGVRKYAADPEAQNAGAELALFANEGFSDDQEGISVYQVSDGTGYIIVSDQGANTYHIYKREGEPGNPHKHQQVKVVKLTTNASDGSDVSNAALGSAFPLGLFVSMSDDRTFHYYSWSDIAGSDLVIAPGGRKVAR